MYTRSFLETLIQIFEAGIAISALSLLIRALSFNLRDRVSRSFAVILTCVMFVFSGEAIGGAVEDPGQMEFWLRFQWLGILYFPPAMLHFSDAILETTGRPSRGRRRKIILFSYALSTLLIFSLLTQLFLGPVIFEDDFPHLTYTAFSNAFILYYLGALILSGVVIWRAYRRTRLRVSQRRIRYLLAGMLFLALGAYPYLQIGSSFAQQFPLFFLVLVALGNVGIFTCLLLMAYAIAFFGVSWPDRIVRSRLFKWLLRGPVTVFIVLILMTSVHHVGNFYGTPYSVAIPIVTVLTVLLIEHIVTLVYPFMERWIFNGGEHENIQLLQTFSERLVTTGDLRQFLETILASVCDQFQVSTGFIAALSDSGLELVVRFGDEDIQHQNGLDEILLEKVVENETNQSVEVFTWGDYWIYPLHSLERRELLGLIGIHRKDSHHFEGGLGEALALLGQRAEMALEDRQLQKQFFEGLEALNMKVDLIQRIRAASRYDQTELLAEIDSFTGPNNLSQWVKEALSHYWGGPKLTESPLMGLEIVQKALEDHDGNTANALRAILRKGVEQVRPDGERRFTGEWILYNILEMKFLEGRKVREIALRLAMSEADLYRKQRVAIEAVAQAIVDMELKVREN
ncbi:MAG: histidine kinase N-terminal 7TM domain-containing protein [Anaerolineales bacterium]|jgi:uncharacterized membrane protein